MEKIDEGETIGKKEIDKPKTLEEHRKRKALIARRALIYGALVIALKLSRCGENCSAGLENPDVESLTSKKSEAKDFPEECASENGENRAKEFLGTWVRKPNPWESDTISIGERNLQKKPGVILLDGKEARLCLPVYVTNIPYDPYGGIYQWDGKFCIILWCSAVSRNVIIPIRKNKGVMQLGVSKRYENIPIHESFYPHWEVDHHYSPEIWLNYHQPSNR